jgi:hypothetical protein
VTTLIVPTPSVQAALSGPGLAVLEKPVTLVSAGVSLPDGTATTDQTPGVVAGFFVFRRKASTVTEVWDAAQKTWRVLGDNVVMTLQPKPLAYKKETNTWEGLFVASADPGAVEAGSTDYLFRTFFRAPYGNATIAGLSIATSALRFIAMIDAAQGGLKIENPESATEVLLFLRDSAKQLIGSVHLIAESGSARVELTNSTGAFVRLTALGDIELSPKAGRNVIVDNGAGAGLFVNGVQVA